MSAKTAIEFLNIQIQRDQEHIKGLREQIVKLRLDCKHDWQLVSALPYHNIRFLHCSLCDSDKSEKINKDSKIQV